MTMTELQQEQAFLCPCSCCIDALARHVSGRDFFDACNCEDYEVNEQCDCWFCEMVIS